MSINNITRTNTIDEWRIQTNQSAGELNKLETGNYTKTSGTLKVEGASNVVIDAQGTALQVTNTALFSTNVTVGKEISLGAQETATGNLGVGGIVSVYGTNTALYVANNIVSNGSVVVKSNIVANNLTVNSNTVVVGTANLGYLGVANSGVFGKNVSVGTTLSVTGNTTVGNLTTANMVYAGTLAVEGRTDISGILHSIGDATFDGDASVAGDLTVDGNFTLTGEIVYDTNILVLSANTPVTSGYAYLGVNRGNTTGTLGTSNANAYIRWTETDKIWQIRDVDNTDTITAFSKVLTANLISANLQSVANTTFPSTWVTKNYVENANTWLKNYVDTTASLPTQANTGAIRIDLTTEIANRQANVGAGLIATSTAAQANTGAARIEALSAIVTANTNMKNYVDTSASLPTQANTGAIRIDLVAEIANRQANVGAAVINTTNGYQSNTGAARIEALNATSTANTNMKNYVDTRSTTNISEGTNLYFTNARARAAISASGSLSYNSTTGVISYSAPTTVSSFTNDSGYITSGGRAYPRRSDGGDLNFYWSGQSGQPTWLWGGTDGANMYVYNPSNFSVSYATTAGTAGNISSYTINQSVGTGNSPTFANVYSGAFYYTSDRKLKTNIVPLADSNSIIASLNPVSFSWIESGKSDSGFIAQEVQEILPNSVSEREDGTLTVNDSAIVAHLVAVVQDLQKRIIELESK